MANATTTHRTAAHAAEDFGIRRLSPASGKPGYGNHLGNAGKRSDLPRRPRQPTIDKFHGAKEFESRSAKKLPDPSPSPGCRRRRHMSGSTKREWSFVLVALCAVGVDDY